MRPLARRTFVAGAALAPLWLLAERTQATLMGGLSLPALLAQSQHVVLLTGLSVRCITVAIAGRPAIVTETRARVEDVYAMSAPSSAEVSVRTLGGVLDGVGELVHGQAELAIGAQCLLFLTRAPDDSLWVSGMAQGHYPVVAAANSELRLAVSPRLPTLRDFEHSAVRALVGQELSRARRLISEAAR